MDLEARRIAVVEDDPKYLQSMIDLLHQDGHQLSVYESLDLVLRAIRKGAFAESLIQIAVVDSRLSAFSRGDRDGAMIAHELRRDARINQRVVPHIIGNTFIGEIVQGADTNNPGRDLTSLLALVRAAPDVYVQGSRSLGTGFSR